MFSYFKIVWPSSTDVTLLFLHFDIERLHIHTLIHYLSGCAWEWKRVHSCRNGDNDVILQQPLEGDELPHLLLLTWSSLFLFVCFFKYVLTPCMCFVCMCFDSKLPLAYTLGHNCFDMFWSFKLILLLQMCTKCEEGIEKKTDKIIFLTPAESPNTRDEPPGLPLWLVQSDHLPGSENSPGKDGMHLKGHW